MTPVAGLGVRPHAAAVYCRSRHSSRGIEPSARQQVGRRRRGGHGRPVATVVSLFAVAVGILCGSILLGWVSATRRLVDGVRFPADGSTGALSPCV